MNIRVVFVAIVAWLALPLHATITSSALTGRVMAGDAPAVGATVTATLRATQTTRTATTNARGSYWLGALAPGVYDVSFSRAGLTSLSRPVTIQLGRIARADAKLEVSADEESVTSTATTVSVAESTVISTHWSGDELERVPLRRDVIAAAILSPTPFEVEAILDDANVFFPSLLGEDALDQATVMRGALPIELDGFGGGVILGRTRSGSDTFSLSLRDTYSTRDGGGNMIETTSGGRIVPDRLWFFAAGWGGEATDVHLNRLRGFMVKATAQATASHQFIASHFDADARFRSFDFDTTATSLRYTGIVNERFIAEAIGSRARGSAEGFHGDGDELAAKLSYRIGDHVLSAGGSDHRDAFYVSDRWSVGRWSIDGGVRRDDQRTTPRIAAIFDLDSERGSHALVASWGEYLGDLPLAGPRRSDVLRVATFGYTSSLESTGAARIDFLRYDGARELDQVQLDARYRMFDRFEAGGSYTYSRGHDAERAHVGHVRVGLQLPFAGRELAATLLEHYDAQTWTTDLAVRYEVPLRRIGLTFAADATNLFDDRSVLERPRALRFWIRAHL